MKGAETAEIVAKGIEALSRGHTHLALVCFERAAQMERSPIISSYLAFCLAAARGRFEEAMAMGNEALAKEPTNAVHYLNLGRVYLLAGRKEEAIRIFRQGVQHEGHEEVIRELERLGTRKPPVIRLLRREHLLNRWLGIILGKLGLR